MQTVSFETAKKLKEAGFPQPEMDIVAGISFWPEGTFFYDGDSLQVSGCISWAEHHIYAPTATELLPEDWLLMREGPNWICQHFEDSHKYVIDDNPAETAALAWLYVNKK